MENKTNSVIKKISAILQEGLNVEKKGFNDHHKYKFVTEQDVLEAVRTKFQAHKLVYHFTVLQSEQVKEDVVRITYEFTIIDSETNDQFACTVVGDGHDRTDKGPYKAFTGAQKYFFMKLFMIATNDDPEIESQSKNSSQEDTDETPAADVKLKASRRFSLKPKSEG